MKIGVPKEIKNHEYRVGLTPSSVKEFTNAGHEVFIETSAGSGIGASDEDYQEAGASILKSAKDIFATAEMIVKVKEPQPVECEMLEARHLLFTYLHLAPDPKQTELLLKSGCTAIAYETVTAADGTLPLLTPMSEVAGRMATIAGVNFLQKPHGGEGVLLGGVPGVMPANVLVIGGGVVGVHAAKMAAGLGANVVILERNLSRIRHLDEIFSGRVDIVFSNTDTLEKELARSSLVIGAVLIPGAAAPKLVSREQLALMPKNAVLVDVAIDQGGCFETSHATTHAEPTFVVDDIIHYCVANMPGAYPKTSAHALNNATLPFGLALANKGWRKALQDNAHLRNGLNIHDGKVTNQPVAEALGYEYISPEDIL
ncbi:MAG: alanine dehydrogenase [Alphaproteobacteria bacterium]